MTMSAQAGREATGVSIDRTASAAVRFESGRIAPRLRGAVERRWVMAMGPLGWGARGLAPRSGAGAGPRPTAGGPAGRFVLRELLAVALADEVEVVGVDGAVAVDVEVGQRDADRAQAVDLVAEEDRVLAVDHAVVVHVTRQDVQPAGELGQRRAGDVQRHAVGLVDPLRQDDREGDRRERDG